MQLLITTNNLFIYVCVCVCVCVCVNARECVPFDVLVVAAPLCQCVSHIWALDWWVSVLICRLTGALASGGREFSSGGRGYQYCPSAGHSVICSFSALPVEGVVLQYLLSQVTHRLCWKPHPSASPPTVRLSRWTMRRTTTHKGNINAGVRGMRWAWAARASGSIGKERTQSIREDRSRSLRLWNAAQRNWDGFVARVRVGQKGGRGWDFWVVVIGCHFIFRVAFVTSRGITLKKKDIRHKKCIRVFLQFWALFNVFGWDIKASYAYQGCIYLINVE